MMWEEFEKLAGYSVTYEDYINVIEPMYMATNLNKQDFVECLNPKRFSLEYRRKMLRKQLISDMRVLAQTVFDNLGETGMEGWDAWISLRAKAREYDKAFRHYGATPEFEMSGGAYSYAKALVWHDDETYEVVDRIELVSERRQP